MIRLLIITSLFGMISCNTFSGKSNLRGADYRLFKDTPAWKLASAVNDEDLEEIKNQVRINNSLIDFTESIYGQTLLHLAVTNQNSKSVKALLKLGADPNHHDNYDGTSPVIHAAKLNSQDTLILGLLLEHGGNPNDIEVGPRRKGSSSRLTPLIAASSKNSLPKVELLIKYGADINYKNEFNISSLSTSLILDNLDVTYYLIQNGAEYYAPIRIVNGKDYYLWDELKYKLYYLDSYNYKIKLNIIKYLQNNGFEYKRLPIPEYALNQAKKMYPNSWKDYLETY